MTSYKGLDMNLALEDTNMNMDAADTRVVFSVAHTFNF